MFEVIRNCDSCEFNFAGICASEFYGERIENVDTSKPCRGYGISLEAFTQVLDSLPESERIKFLNDNRSFSELEGVAYIYVR